MKQVFSLLLLLLLCSCGNTEPKIYQWRGEGRSGIYPDRNLLKEWPENGPEEIWTVESIGKGYGSPVFTDDQLFITGEIDSMAILYCMNLHGEILWQADFGKEWVSSFPGSRSAPTIVGDLVYVGSGLGNLFCLSRENGSKLWSRDFKEDFNGTYPLHGISEAAVIHNDKVFWTPGGEVYNVVALNRFTGESIWSHPGFGERPGYNTANLIKHMDRPIYVTLSAYHLMGFDADSGELLWSQEQDNLPIEERDMGYGDTHPNAAIYDNGSIYYVVSDGNDGVRLDLSGDGSEITEVWRNHGFDSFMGGIIKIGDFIYGNSDSQRTLVGINAATGELSDSLKIGNGVLIAADAMLYYYNQKGEMKLISYEQGKLKEISSFKITKGTKHHFSHPVINKGILYLRRGQALMAFDIRKLGS